MELIVVLIQLAPLFFLWSIAFDTRRSVRILESIDQRLKERNL
jgi:hypothetical protein